MKKIIECLKGMAIGASNVVAGLSGGTIAVLCKVYDKFVSLFSDFIHSPIKVIKTNLFFILGIGLGFLIAALTLSGLYEKYPLEVSCLFSGLVLSGVPLLIKNVDFKNKNKTSILLVITSFLLVVMLPLLTNSTVKEITFNLPTMIIVFFLGSIAMSTMIIPGVSGSMILTLSGYYGIWGLISDTISNIVNKEYNLLFENILILSSFGFGCIVGVVLMAKLIKMLFKKYANIINALILGLVLGSCISMITISVKSTNYYIWSWSTLTSAILFMCGLTGGILINMLTKEKELNYIEKALEKKDEGIKLLGELISYKTVLEEFNPNSDAPFGEENKKVLNYFLNKASEDGFEVYNDQNYAGHVELGPKDGQLVGVLAHLDVVPVTGQTWNTDPFTLVEKDGKLYGRGTEDDKGPLVASYLALKIIKELDLKVSKRVRIIVGCDEESGSRCLAHYFKTQEMPEIGFSPDAEFPLIYGEKANASFDVLIKLDEEEIIEEFICGDRYNIVPALAKMKLKKDLKEQYLKFLNETSYKGEIDGDYLVAFGVGAHAMVPQNGVNAATILFEFLNKYYPTTLSKWYVDYLANDPFGKKSGIAVYDEDMKDLTLNVAVVKTNNNVLKIGMNSRIPVNDYLPVIKEKFNQTFPNSSFEFKELFGSRCHFIDPKSQLVTTLMNAYQEISGDYNNKPFTIGGGTYARFIKQAVAFGPMFPGSEDVCHIANEYIKVEDFVKSIAIYTKAIYDLIK